MSLFIGLDVGTQSCKCVVWDSQKKAVVSSGQKSYGVLSQRPGQAEQDPKTWIKAIEKSTQQALGNVNRNEVAAMAVSGQQHGMVALDASGSVIRNAKLWCDVESATQAETITHKLGCKVVPGFTATKMLWLAENEPENWDATKHVLLPSQYINYFLTGNMAMECGDASGTGLFDIYNRNHSQEAIWQVLGEERAGIFPAIIKPTALVGNVKKSVAELLGIPDSTVVAPGSGDNMMSALGRMITLAKHLLPVHDRLRRGVYAGVGAVEAGDLVMSLGTSGTLFCPSEEPVMDVEGRIAPFCDAAGKWLPLICTMNCTGCPEEIQKAYSLSLQEATDLAAQEPPGCEGVNVLPYFTGERTPDWPHSRGSILGLTPGMLQRPGLMYRAALEGSTYSLAAGISLLEEFGVATTSVRLVGGGSKNKLWRQIVADVLNKPVVIPRVEESAATGAALQAAAAFFEADIAEFVKENGAGLEQGVVEPRPGNSDTYAAAQLRHTLAGEALFGQPLVSNV